MTPEEILTAVAGYAADRKAIDIVSLDLREIIGYTDYFVICTGRTDRQTKAIADAIHEGMNPRDAFPHPDGASRHPGAGFGLCVGFSSGRGRGR